MPEGHSIHRLAAAFDELLAGQRIDVSSPQGRFADGARVLNGRRYEGSEAYGKHLFQHFDDLVLHTHLGLYGSWTFDGDASFVAPHAIGAPRRRIGESEELAGEITPTDVWAPPEPRGQVRVRLATNHGIADLTGPNQCRVLSAPETLAVTSRLGPDPLRADADPERFITRARQLRRPIGELVMDQAVISGPGNIYRAEALFIAGIHPWRPGNRVSIARLRTLWDVLAEHMKNGVETGSIVTTSEGEQERFYVYQRAGLPCLVCTTPIVLEEMAARKLYRCPRCQR
ncbi:formamidopyrimidine-DNA glycosylase [Bowdeniella nasicola]|uniref:DNA-(apurinic or apyrimidinic site) lyase n=1 Tax=Bowdeniella nasicola TaxID=208480 RepID=A0A1H4CDW8_9ACTO|nr:DNA-formamidopyrimidine glycosylase family protein [Bowdeniella nasicola]SEA58520.1 formamidopyrimidine-DNA glycosylase [Bowdeniella nasicola]